MFVRKLSDGKYYLCTRSGTWGSGALKSTALFKSQFKVKNNNDKGVVCGIVFPKELIGKNVMFPVEVIE